MHTFNWVLCIAALVGLAFRLSSVARLFKGNRIVGSRERLMPLLKNLCYAAGMGLLFLSVWLPLRHNSGDIDEKFLLPALLFAFVPDLYPSWQKVFSGNRLKSGQAPDTKQ